MKLLLCWHGFTQIEFSTQLHPCSFKLNSQYLSSTVIHEICFFFAEQFICAKDIVNVYITFSLVLQYAGCNPSKKVLQKFWGPKTGLFLKKKKKELY